MALVWVTIPSARSSVDVRAWAAAWRQMGYAIALWRDPDSEDLGFGPEDIVVRDVYPGYGAAVNRLMALVRKADPEMRWCVTGGDDVQCDMRLSGPAIAVQLLREFFWRSFEAIGKTSFRIPNDVRGDAEHTPLRLLMQMPLASFGVMQPTGDRFAEGSIDRIAGSAWIGRYFQEHAYGGKGPLWEEYRHMFDDEELQAVACMLGVFQQRPDLVHLHRHFMRESDALDAPAIRRPPPPHLVAANSPEHWAKVQVLFRARRAAGFPGHEVV